MLDFNDTVSAALVPFLAIAKLAAPLSALSFGVAATGLSALIAGSFQVLIWPEKIFATVAGVIFNTVPAGFTPSRRYAMSIAPEIRGIHTNDER